MKTTQRLSVRRRACSGRTACVVVLVFGVVALATGRAQADVQRLPSMPVQPFGAEGSAINPMYPPVVDNTPPQERPSWAVAPLAAAPAGTMAGSGVLLPGGQVRYAGGGVGPTMVESVPSPPPDWPQAVAPQTQPIVVTPGPYSNGAGGPWCWQLLPEGLIYHSYLAGVKEPRFASQWVHDSDTDGWLWDITLGGRVGILRYGTQGPYLPEGWELDIEGAAFPQLDLEHDRDLNSCDYRFGIPLTWGHGWYQTKLAYYHLSSHLGDEYMIRNTGADRINYVRDAIVWGNSIYPYEDLRLYAEAAWSFHTDGGAEPWEFQFGVEYSPAAPTGLRGSPFVAVNGQLREELDYGGNVVVQTGWQWRGLSGRLMRVGMQYYAGYSDQYEFYDRYIDKLGIGLWYDF